MGGCVVEEMDGFRGGEGIEEEVEEEEEGVLGFW